MGQEEAEVKKRYNSLEQQCEKITSRIKKNLTEAEEQIEGKLDSLYQSQEKNLSRIEKEVQTKKVSESKITTYLDDKFLALKSDLQNE